jgi:ribosomal protein L31E
MPRGKPNPRRINAKLCFGPSHENPTWKNITDFNLVKGRRWYECKLCHAHRRKTRTNYSHVPFERVGFAITELVNRLGKAEASRRIGISKQQISHYCNHDPRWIRKQTAVKILRALSALRATEEVRHKDSIHAGAYLRGIPEKKVTARVHLYKRDGDEQNWKRTANRRISVGVKNPTAARG